MANRPQATHKDENHWIPRDFLRDRCGGFGTIKLGRTRAYTANYIGRWFILFDMSDYGGVFSDWLLFLPERSEYRWLEIKTEEAYKKQDHELTDGEIWLQNSFSGAFQIIVTDDDFQEILDGML